MFFLKFKRSFNRALFFPLLVCLFLGNNAYAEVKITKSKLYVQENSSGGKAAHTVVLKAPTVPAGQCALLVKAEVKHEKQRFGKAEILPEPAKGCNPKKQSCRVQVAWGHAPVGKLHYRVVSTWNVSSSGC